MQEAGGVMEEIGGLDESILNQIVEIILSYKKVKKIVIFGSRADDNFENTSDIDIAIFDKEWTDKDINVVKFNLDEYIKTPLKFDVLNFYALTKPELKDDILKRGKVIYESAKS